MFKLLLLATLCAVLAAAVDARQVELSDEPRPTPPQGDVVAPPAGQAAGHHAKREAPLKTDDKKPCCGVSDTKPNPGPVPKQAHVQ